MLSGPFLGTCMAELLFFGRVYDMRQATELSVLLYLNGLRDYLPTNTDQHRVFF